MLSFGIQGHFDALPKYQYVPNNYITIFSRVMTKENMVLTKFSQVHVKVVFFFFLCDKYNV